MTLIISLQSKALMKKISGIMQFQRMNASGINLLREIQRSQPNVRIIFSDDLSGAVVEWESFNNLAQLTRLAASIETGESKPPHRD